jgi:hypothetical protein
MSSSTTSSNSQAAPPTLKDVLLEADIRNKLYEVMRNEDLTVEMAVLYLMRDNTFDFKALLKCLEGSFRHPHLVTSLYLYLTGNVMLTCP